MNNKGMSVEASVQEDMSAIIDARVYWLCIPKCILFKYGKTH